MWPCAALTRKNALTVRLYGELDHSAATGIRTELDALIAQTGRADRPDRREKADLRFERA